MEKTHQAETFLDLDQWWHQQSSGMPTEETPRDSIHDVGFLLLFCVDISQRLIKVDAELSCSVQCLIITSKSHQVLSTCDIRRPNYSL